MIQDLFLTIIVFIIGCAVAVPIVHNNYLNYKLKIKESDERKYKIEDVADIVEKHFREKEAKKETKESANDSGI